MCFSYSSLKEIRISSSVQTIKSYSFYSCQCLEKVEIPKESKLSKIETASFYECKKMKEFHFPSEIKNISNKTFAFTGLINIEIPKSVKRVNSMSFYGCKNLKKVVFNEGIKEIGKSAFENNIELNVIDIPDSLMIIKSNAFSNCINLTKVNTTKNTHLIEIQNGAFENTKIEELSINKDAKKLFDPNNVPNLNKIIFYKGLPLNFIQLKDGTIYKKMENDKKNDPQSFFNIEQNLHLNFIISTSKTCQSFCKYLKKCSDDVYYDFSWYFNIESPKDSFKEIENYSEDYVYYGKLKKIYDNIHHKNSLSNVCFEETIQKSKEDYKLRLVYAPKNLECLKIHPDCISISNSILSDMKNLNTIEYMKGETNFIVNFPNYNHLYTTEFNKIKTVKIMGNNSFMEEKVFSFFDSLEIVEFNQSTNLYFISKFAFLECRNLQKVGIPSSCLSIEEGAFKNCINLKSVKFDLNQSKLNFIQKEAFYNCCSLVEMHIPATIYGIGESSFMNCEKLKTVVICPSNQNHEGLKAIGKNAFKNCSSLIFFDLPTGCELLGEACFMNCVNLQSFKYDGSELQNIPSRAFYNCSSLKQFEINNLEYFDNHVPLNTDMKYLKKNVFYIGSEAFTNCTSLIEVTIEDKSKNIDSIQYNENKVPIFLYPNHLIKKTKQIFYNQTTLYYIYKHELTEYLFTTRQTIQRRAFYNCKSLKKVRVFLGNLECIHENAFYDCKSLEVVEVNSQFWRFLIHENLDPSAFAGAKSDIEIKLFNNNSIVFSIKNATNKINHKYHVVMLNNNLSSLNKSFIHWPIKNEEMKRNKTKETCINCFDGPKFSIRIGKRDKTFFGKKTSLLDFLRL